MDDGALDATDGGVDRTARAFDERLARIVVRPLANTPVTPNMLTFTGMGIGLWAAWLFSLGEPRAASLAGFLFAVAVFMDHVDGEHARATGQVTRFGHYFDHFAASVTYGSAFIGIGIGLSLRGGVLGQSAVLLGVVAAVAVVAIFALRVWIEGRFGLTAVDQTPHAGFEIEDTLYIVAPVAWLGGLEPFLIAAGLGSPLFLLWVVWDAVRLSRSRGREQTAK